MESHMILMKRGWYGHVTDINYRPAKSRIT